MKKLLALVLAVLVVCAVPAMAFAADSPGGKKIYNVTVQKASIDGTDKTQTTVDDGGNITVKVDASVGTFNNWKIYKVSTTTADAGVAAEAAVLTVGDLTAATKYVEAVEGTDYTIVSGSLKSTTVTVKPLTDIVICANYNNMLTDPQTGSMNEKAPQTGVNVALLVFVCALSLAGVGVAVKKVVA